MKEKIAIRKNTGIDSKFGYKLDKHVLSKGRCGFENEVHTHSYFEIEIVLKGTLIHEFNGEKIKVGRGYACLMMPNDFHTLHIEEDEDVYIYNIIFLEHRIANSILLEMFKSRAKSKIQVQFDEVQLERVKKLYDMMYEEYTQKKLLSEMVASSLLNCIVAEILRNFKPVGEETGEENMLNEVLLRIEENICSPEFSLQTLSQKLRKSSKYISAMIKDELGVTFNQYLLTKRIEHAKKLLQNSNVRVYDVAAYCGFNSSTYFIKKFREETGISPKEFAQRNK